jgi:hypothetical protein
MDRGAGEGGQIMGVMDGFTPQESELVNSTMRLHTELSARHARPPGPAEFDEWGFPGRIIEAAYSPGTPPAGIFGVGLTHLSDQLRPTVFAMLEMLTAPIEITHDSGQESPPTTPMQRMLRSYRPRLPANTLIVGLPAIKNYVSSGNVISVDSECSTLGAPATLPSGRRCYLTAGHGARTMGAAVLVDGSAIGTVTFSSCRELSPGSGAVADVAVVALDSTMHETPLGGASIVSAGYAPPQSLVSVRQRGGLQRGRVWGVSPAFYVDSYAGWGEVMLCSAMSVPGDSGSAVVRDDDATTCVGHVVGGREDYLTVVQQLQYQLDAAQVTLRDQRSAL